MIEITITEPPKCDKCQFRVNELGYCYDSIALIMSVTCIHCGLDDLIRFAHDVRFSSKY